MENRQSNQKLFIKASILSLIAGVIIGSIVSGYVVYNTITKTYYQVHNSNIGGFVFKGGKVYSLEELKSMYPGK